MKKLLLVFIVLVLLFGCTPKDNNTDPDSSNQTVTYQENVVIYPPTDNNDTIISVSLAQKVQAEVAGYIVNDGKWELIFKAMSIDLNSTDYIAIKNNYSNYNTIYIGIGANGPFDINASGQVSYKQVQHNLSLVTSSGAKVTSTHQFYEDMNKNHPHKGLFYILDNYKFEIDKEPAKPGDVVLSIQNISVKNSRDQMAVKDLSLDIRAGEVVGIAGVDGNGQSELIFGITGMSPLESGKIYLHGKDISNYSIRKRIEAGVGHIPEDRRKHGLVSEFTVAENVVLKNYYKKPYTMKGCLLNIPEMNKKAEQLISDFDIRAGEGALTKVGSMSGGNQQKVIIAREIELSPEVLIVAQPTRGLDVGAIEYIRKRIIAERDKGKAILLISFELDEIMNLCDRIATISKGTIVGIFNEGEVTEREIGIMMAGSKHKEGEVK